MGSSSLRLAAFRSLFHFCHIYRTLNSIKAIGERETRRHAVKILKCKTSIYLRPIQLHMPGLHFCGSRLDKVNKKFKNFVLEIVEPVLLARSYEN